MSNQSAHFGTDPIGKLLREQAIPAAIGILVMSIYGIVDTIFVGRWVGAMGIAAITVVMPITYLISSIGMAIGVGGASVLSRALGADNEEKAFRTFGNQVGLTLTLAVVFVLLGAVLMDDVLRIFGGQGRILEPSREYFSIILYGIPFLAWAMMSNNVIRAEGHPRVAMFILVVPAVVNIILDPIFIVWLDMGLEGAAWATTISYIASATYACWFFLFGKSELRITRRCMVPNLGIIREIASIGSVTLARQGTISLLIIVLNNSLFAYGGELAISVYGIINRLMMFVVFPVFGITQGVLPIVGFNYGAKLWQRVKDSVTLAIKSATIIATMVFILIMIFTEQLVGIFTTDTNLIEMTVPALRMVFLATPLIAINLIGSAYFQAIGKALPALLLTLSKQGIFLIPLVLLMPLYFELDGVWMAFPIADVGAALVTYIYLRKGTQKLDRQTEEQETEVVAVAEE